MRTSDEHFTLLRGPHIVLLLWKGEHDYARVLVVSLVFGFCQVGLSAVVIVAIQIAFTAGTEPRWLDAVILCSLQLFVGTNVAYFLRHLGQKLMRQTACPDTSYSQRLSPGDMGSQWQYRLDYT
jgi:hypothetical protein